MSQPATSTSPETKRKSPQPLARQMQSTESNDHRPESAVAAHESPSDQPSDDKLSDSTGNPDASADITKADAATEPPKHSNDEVGTDAITKDLNDELLRLLGQRFPRLDDALELFDQMVYQDVSPTKRVYRALLVACTDAVYGRHSKIDAIIKILKYMLKQGETLPLSACATVIQRCANNKPEPLCDAAIQVFNLLLEAKQVPDIVAYSGVIRACGAAKPRARIPDLMKVFRSMEAIGVYPDQVAFNVFMHSCSKTKPSFIDEALVLRSKLDDMGVVLDTYSLPALLRCCAYAQGRRRAALAMNIFIEATTARNLQMNPHVTRALVSSVGPERAEDLLEFIKSTKPWQKSSASRSRAKSRSSLDHKRSNSKPTSKQKDNSTPRSKQTQSTSSKSSSDYDKQGSSLSTPDDNKSGSPKSSPDQNRKRSTSSSSLQEDKKIKVE